MTELRKEQLEKGREEMLRRQQQQQQQQRERQRRQERQQQECHRTEHQQRERQLQPITVAGPEEQQEQTSPTDIHNQTGCFEELLTGQDGEAEVSQEEEEVVLGDEARAIIEASLASAEAAVTAAKKALDIRAETVRKVMAGKVKRSWSETTIPPLTATSSLSDVIQHARLCYGLAPLSPPTSQALASRCPAVFEALY